MNLFRFENGYILYGLLLIPVLWIMFLIAQRLIRKNLDRYGELALITRLMPLLSNARKKWKFFLLLVALVFIIIGLANPQIGSRLVKAERKGIDLVIALDVSNSMLAQDIVPNRLERAKKAISRLIDNLQGDRIGIVIFAGKAYIQLPITTDYSAAKLFLSTISPEIVPTQGTAIGEAIRLSVESFDENDHSKAVIVITDGENHEGDALLEANKASEMGIKVYTIGMGLPQGAPIPLYSGNNQIGFKKDKQGNTIVSRLNETMLQQIASAGNGVYVAASNTEAGLRTVFDEINSLEKKEYESRMFSEYESRFQYLIIPALLILVLELFIFERKSKWSRYFRLFEKNE